MEIKKLSDNKLRICLSSLELFSYGLCYDDLTSRGENTREMLISLLQTARLRHNIDTTGKKLTVETYPEEDGGCVVYFNFSGKPEKIITNQSPILIVFENTEDLALVTKEIILPKLSLILSSSLYKQNGQYLLLITPGCALCKLIETLSGEFSLQVFSDDFIETYLLENGEAIILNDAVIYIIENY